MSSYCIENDRLKVMFRSKSAELTSIVKKETGVEYLWCGDSTYWGWTSPVLFPIVGNVRDKQYTYDGRTYSLNQHGFARNQEFSLISRTETEIWFALESSEETKAEYPFDFCLEIGYVLADNQVKVCWRVKNTDDKILYFSIGAHPAFMCPLDGKGEQTDYYMGFETAEKELQYRLIDESCGLIDPKEYPLSLQDGLHRIEKEQFDKDALVIEHHQTQKMFLAGPDKIPYVTVDFDAPLFGIWSPAGKGAPFICIEPWYGRSDSIEFYGPLEEREYGNQAKPGEVFEKSYTITIE